MAEEDGQERTEEATPKRREDAKRKGQVPRSRELNTTAMTVMAAVALLVMGKGMVESLGALVTEGLSPGRELIFEPMGSVQFLAHAVGEGLVIAAPFFAVMIIVALASSVALGGWSFSLESLAFKLDKLDPVKGMKRLFSARGLMELGKALIKFFLVGGVAAFLLYGLADEFLGLGGESIKAALGHAGALLGWTFLILSLTLIVIAAVDVPFQLWDHARQLKMTKQQVKDEQKDTEGKPEVKSRVRNAQRELSQRRMMEQVPKADVVVTNPTHFAVALRYDADTMGAPRVVAKGTDLVAGQIRSIALASGVPLVPAPPLARAIYYSTELDQEVPAALYVAVAQVLAYVYQVRAADARGEQAPPVPTDLPVPDDLHRGRRGYHA